VSEKKIFDGIGVHNHIPFKFCLTDIKQIV